LCLLAVTGGTAEAQLYEPIQAQSYCIMDADTGRVLSAQNQHTMLPPASTVKVGTALMAVDSLRLTDRVPVSYRAAEAPPSKIYLKPGQTYSVHDLLYAIMLPSANDAARALSERVSGSEERFAAQMTSRLRQLGAYRTNFATASGLSDPGQYSTAYDLCLIFRHAMQNPTLAKIMSTKSYILPNGRMVRNNNWSLFTADCAVAGKTGYTRASKHTFVGMFENNNRRIIVSLLGSPDKWADLRLLIPKGLDEIGAPIAPLPPLRTALRQTESGYEVDTRAAARPRQVKSRTARTSATARAGAGSRKQVQTASSRRGPVMQASIASPGGAVKAGRTPARHTPAARKKTVKPRVNSSTSSIARPRS